MRKDKSAIVEDFRSLGIIEGDFLFITADLLRVGYFNKDRLTTEADWVDILRTVVGDSGDVIVACYSDSFLKFKAKQDLEFDATTLTTSGALSRILLDYPGSFRSSHPTNSYVGFGSRAKDILFNHDHTKGSYQVVEDILQHKAKNMLIGTIDKKNAPMAFHQVQHNLGYNYKHPFAGLGQVYHYVNGKRELFTRYDVGGCSGGSYQLLPELLNLSATRFGNIGRAKTLVLDGVQSHDKLTSILTSKVDVANCHDSKCIGCHGRFNNPLFLKAYILNLPKILSYLFR